VRYVEILQGLLEVNLQNVHRRRRAAVWRAVLAVIVGGKLGLTALGRALPTATTDKHRIKAIDRLVGNRLLHGEITLFYRALAAWLLRKNRCPVIAVDWTGVGPHHYELSAKLCADGRALPLYSRVFPKKLQGNRVAHRTLLMELASVLPPGSTPVFVTDSGFHSNWFDDVVWHGWDYIGRVRGRTHAAVDGRWQKPQGLHRRAGNRPKDLGWALMPFNKPRVHRLVLSKRPTPQGRSRRTRRGTPSRSKTAREASVAAREPWLLATSLGSNAKLVVQTYGLRMQIEQSFRDRKSYRYGWSLRSVITRSCARLEVILLLASLAEVAVNIVGRAVAASPCARQFSSEHSPHAPSVVVLLSRLPSDTLRLRSWLAFTTRRTRDNAQIDRPKCRRIRIDMRGSLRSGPC
jgi:hypothetical protein